MNRAWVRTAIFVFGAVGAFIGCSSSGDSSSAAPSATPTQAPVPAAGSTATIDGAALFAQNCSGCHGDKGVGGKRAPKLAGRHLASGEAIKIIGSGKGRMPAFGTRLKSDQISAIADYVTTL
jgi:mono/diheme cytochrome c family protein